MDAPLSGEDFEEVGGGEVVVPYGVRPSETVVALAFLAFLSFIGAGGLLVIRDRFGFPPWAGAGRTDELLHLGLVLSGDGVAWLMFAWTLLLTLARRLGSSPALVAGKHGVRVHGAWPWPRTLRWDEVARVAVDDHEVRVVAEPHRPPPLRGFLGDPLRASLRAGVDLEALREALRRARSG